MKINIRGKEFHCGESNFRFENRTNNQERFYGNYIIPEEIDKKVAIDLGCNVGFFEMEHYNVFDNIYAFDASYENTVVTLRKILAKNLRDNEAKNVFCFNLAAGSKTGEIIKVYQHMFSCESVSPMTNKDMFTSQYGLVWKEEIEPYHNVFTISLEGLYDFLSIDYIDYLKIDIEGAEYDFLLEKDLSRIGCLALELHGTLGRERKDAMKEYLLKYFDIHHIEYDDEAPQHSEITYINKSFRK